MRDQHVTPDPSRALFEAFVRWSVQQEMPVACGFLGAPLCRAFRDYFRALPAPDDEAGLARYTLGLWRGEAGWAARWIAAHPGARVLDAGSGFGTQAMIFACMGAEVVGVELRPDRREAAERRCAFYQRTTGVALPLHYEDGDLTQAWPRDYDLVWAYNAISHIDPMESFLQQAAGHLTRGGVLVIGDINGANPAHLRRLARERKEVHQIYTAPDGTRHAYAVERMFGPRELRDTLEAHGFRVVHHELYMGGLGSFPEPLYQLARRSAPGVGAWLARRQLAVAARCEDSFGPAATAAWAAATREAAGS